MRGVFAGLGISRETNLAQAGKSDSLRNGVSVPVVPITRIPLFKSMLHWCLFNMSSPESKKNLISDNENSSTCQISSKQKRKKF